MGAGAGVAAKGFFTLLQRQLLFFYLRLKKAAQQYPWKKLQSKLQTMKATYSSY